MKPERRAPASRTGDPEIAAREPAIPSWSRVRALIRSARPRQWGKNLLVFAAPAAGGVLFEVDVAIKVGLMFVAFCLAASGIYFVNDLVDRAEDRGHPTKRLRPIAAGLIPTVWASAAAWVLVPSALVVALVVGPALAAVVAAYVVLTLAYTFALRNIVLVDLAAIAGGFLLRAIAGGVAADVTLSSWFLMVASFGSFYIATGKRHAEYVNIGLTRGSHRPTLSEYSESFLRYIQYSSSTVAIAAYALWAFEGETGAGGTVWSGLSIIPFVLGVFRYGLLVDEGKGGSPEDVVLADPPLLVFGLMWVLLVAAGIYLGE